jgi:ribonucleotide reductase alpha subunit
MIDRLWTKGIGDPNDSVKWTKSHIRLANEKTGEVIYEEDVEHPEQWSQNAVDLCASKYLRRADIPEIGGETSVRQLAHRVAHCLAKCGVASGYFDEDGGKVFHDEIVAGFLMQKIGFNSPVWFNFGLYDVYGIVGSKGRDRWFVENGEPRCIDEELVRPGGAACFLTACTDSLFGDEGNSMYDLLATETKVFLTGAGNGVNVSRIRGVGEPIAGGGISAGLQAFLPVRDKSAGYIKSGGKTRRSSSLLACDMDHPDIIWFIEWKENEEKKAKALIKAGWDSDYEGDAYSTISGQNGNNSVRVSDAFMKLVDKHTSTGQDADWHLVSRTPLCKFPKYATTELYVIGDCLQGQLYSDTKDGKPFAILRPCDKAPHKIMSTVKVSELWAKICTSAWVCGCPGVQYDTIINDWNTVPHYDRINTTNPCFSGDTLIPTTNGLVRIKDWAASGERRWIWNNGRWAEAVAYPTEIAQTITLCFANGHKIICTPEHRFQMEGGGETTAEESIGKMLKVSLPKYADVYGCSCWGSVPCMVVSIVPGNIEQVYDFTLIENLEDHERWACVAGVSAHNCAEVSNPDGTTCNLASVNTIHFFADLENPDWVGFEHACRLLTIALDLVVEISSYPTRQHAIGSWNLRPIGLNHGNLGAVLMRNAIAYESREGHAWKSLVTSFMTLHAWETSHELAEKLGHYPAYHPENHGRIIEKHRSAATEMDREGLPPTAVSNLVIRWGAVSKAISFRNNVVTCMVPQGTIGLILDQDTLGCEPDFSLVKAKKCVGGNWMRIVNQSIEPALRKLGYDDKAVDGIIAYILEYGSPEGCALIDPKYLPVFDTAVRPPSRIDWNLTGVRKDRFDHVFPQDIRAACNAAVRKAKTRAEAEKVLTPILKTSGMIGTALLGLKLSTRCISVDGHIDALAAIQPHISMSISKTTNVDNDANVSDISNAYLSGWKKGVKCIAVYRDGSKDSQPLNAASAVSTASKSIADARKPFLEELKEFMRNPAVHDVILPVKRPIPNHSGDADRFRFTLQHQGTRVSIFVTIVRFPGTNRMMEMFVDLGKQGDTIGGLVDTMARLISRGLQYNIPPDEIGDVIEGMNFGPNGFLGTSSVFGIRYVKSVPDLVGKLLKVLPEWYAAGRPDDVLNPQPFQPEHTNAHTHAVQVGASVDHKHGRPEDNAVMIQTPEQAIALGYTGRHCDKCGSLRTRGEGNCFQCLDCSTFNGPCGT